MQKMSLIKVFKIILASMLIASFLFFIIGEIVQPKENELRHQSCESYNRQWCQILKDGSKKCIDTPGRCEAKRGEWVIIENTLPNITQESTLCFHSMQQDVKVYINGELRKEYSTLETQIFGKTSTMTYVFAPLYETDTNANIRIEFMSVSPYSGYVPEMYIGGKSDIVHYLCDLHAPTAIVAALLLIFGIGVVLISIVVYFIDKKLSEMIHLGNGMIVAATWMLVESKLRQFFLPNSTIAMNMGFLMIAILPYPFLSYMNSIQKKRYQIGYTIIAVATVINFIAIVILQVFNIKDFYQTMGSSHIIIGVLLVETAVTILVDTVKKRVRDYREVAIGYLTLTVSGILEIAMVYNASARYNGIPLCLGLIVMLFCTALKSIRDFVNSEKERQYALATSESKAKFLANMSHEIRTPINTILGMNEMILRENEIPEISEYSNNIKSASTTLLGIINDILDFSKIEAGELQIVENEYELAPLIKDIILSIEMRTKNKGLGLKLDIDENMPSVLKGDEIRIRQILNNLLSNAVKYTNKGFVTFCATGTRREDKFDLVLEISDTGIGIKPEDMESIFSSFKRLELEKNRYIEGTGLGLNITKLLVNLMDGKIDVQSEYGEGSCFTVTLTQHIIDDTPLSIEAPDKKAAAKMNVSESICIPDANILVVDDTKINLKVISALLKRTQVNVDMADGGMKCFMMTKTKKYDLILMDHMMPEPDGIETLHMIRNDVGNPNIDTPIIVLTANAIIGAKEEYLKEGFDEYLSKPVKPEALEEMILKYVK